MAASLRGEREYVDGDPRPESSKSRSSERAKMINMDGYREGDLAEDRGRDGSAKRRLSIRLHNAEPGSSSTARGGSAGGYPDKRIRSDDFHSQNHEQHDSYHLRQPPELPSSNQYAHSARQQYRDQHHSRSESRDPPGTASGSNGHSSQSRSGRSSIDAHSADQEHDIEGGEAGDVPRPNTSSGQPPTATPSGAGTAGRLGVAPTLGSRPKWTTYDPEKSSNSSRSSSRHRHSGPMASERMPSPPGMTLSTGLPLVNPPLKTQAAFVGKLYSMLDDDDIRKSGLIHWSNGGTTFTCPNPTEFSKAVLPRFFKHNNWQSFVRQLNMYSFNKVNDLYATSSDPTAWEFRHPLFRQGEPHLLASIKRKTTRPMQPDGPPLVSPTDEMGDRPVAGWMRDRPSSPIGDRDRERDRERERERERERDRDRRRDPRDTHSLRDDIRLGIPPSQHGLNSGPGYDHPQPNDYFYSSRPPPPAEGFYPQPPIPSPSPVAALANQVTFLEDKVVRLAEVLAAERMENTRTQLDLITHMTSIVDRVPDARMIRDSLLRQKVDLRQKYDALLASGGGRFAAQPPPPPSTQIQVQDRLPPLGIPPPSQAQSPMIRSHPLTPRLPPAMASEPTPVLPPPHRPPGMADSGAFSSSPIFYQHQHPHQHRHSRPSDPGGGGESPKPTGIRNLLN